GVTCGQGTYCSVVAIGQCIPDGRVDCGLASCDRGDRCVSSGHCTRAIMIPVEPFSKSSSESPGSTSTNIPPPPPIPDPIPLPSEDTIWTWTSPNQVGCKMGAVVRVYIGWSPFAMCTGNTDGKFSR